MPARGCRPDRSATPTLRTHDRRGTQTAIRQHASLATTIRLHRRTTLPPADKLSLVRSLDDLLAPLHEACKPRSQFRVGTEAEKIGVVKGTFQPVMYEGPNGVESILVALAERFGWTPDREFADGPLIALKRGHASITLEPGAQLELSGAPLASVHDTAAEFENHLQELRAVCDPMGISWLGLGFHPFARQDELPWVPKSRYATMRTYLPTRGIRAHDMMRRTCTVQANLDFSSEADACRKLRVGLALQPVVTAMFANSPFVEGMRGEHLTERGSVWLGMDPDRCGLLPFAWQEDLSFQRYVEWALDVPMFVVKRGSQVFPNTQQTFRQFMQDGLGDVRATSSDWEAHLNTLFPEARLKRIIELRGADSQGHALVVALPALWKGLFDDELALDQAERMVAGWQPSDVEAARPSIARSGLRATLYQRPVGEWASELLQIARGGLERLSVKDASGQDESIHLKPLIALIADGSTPAEQLLKRVNGASDLRQAIVDNAQA